MPIEEITYHSKVMHSDVKFNLAVPKDVTHSHPVMYLYHGVGDDHRTAAQRTNVAELAEKYGVYVVMPDAESNWFVNDPREGMFLWEDYLAVELPDYIASQLAIDAAKTAVAGFSMGGYGAMLYGLLHPERFQTVFARAGSFAFGHELRPDRPERSAFMEAVAPPGGRYDLFALTEKIAADENYAKLSQRIAFNVGQDDHLLAINERFAGHLTSLGIPHSFEVIPGSHRWAWVDEHLEEMFKFWLN